MGGNHHGNNNSKKTYFSVHCRNALPVMVVLFLFKVGKINEWTIGTKIFLKKDRNS